MTTYDTFEAGQQIDRIKDDGSAIRCTVIEFTGMWLRVQLANGELWTMNPADCRPAA